MIVWPAKLSHKPDTFRSAALITSSLCLTANIEEVDAAENGMSLDCDTNMAFTSISGSHMKKQTVHECDFADTDSHMVKGF